MAHNCVIGINLANIALQFEYEKMKETQRGLGHCPDILHFQWKIHTFNVSVELYGANVVTPLTWVDYCTAVEGGWKCNGL